ncbi:phosphate/phosphite/phosphonate ABC transporter substrate-binding protein [Micromonospora trifolii]|uniref:phosphate/phosphite/phosphonate ABC transporter substrate-binding protein n=1 Tax=Micromonospora trifolii TaxID=2911208 RepID=UPI003CE9EC8A
MPAPTVLMGAVAYDPKVVTIWEGFRSWLRGRGLDFDFVLYSHYERQVEDLVAGRIDAAWNSPLAWLRAERLAAANGTSVRALTMRDTDQDLTSVVVVRADSPVGQLADLAGRMVAVGAVDSPQATLIPLGHLAAAGVTVDVRRFDVGVGLHGDHIGGERDAARALVAGEVDAACMIDANHLAFVQEGTLPPEGTRIVAQTARYDHCNMTVRAPESDGVRLFGTLLLGMSYADPQVRPLLDLEGLTAWREGRTTGYDALADAVDATGFYSPDGRVTATDYRP